MSYNYTYITDRTSPNKWVGGNTIKGITIHWWGDPAQNPTAEGVVNWLCNPAAQVSAHLVITGTGRRVWQLVNDSDRAWHAMSGNHSTIGLELDPRCRNEDYDVAAEVIANLWRHYGKLPLYPHKHWVATACPGNYDLGRLQREAEAKLNPPKPAHAPPQHDDLYRVLVGGKQVAAYSTARNAYNGWVAHGSKGKITFKGQDVTTKVVNDHKPVITTKDETKDVVLDFEVKVVSDDTLNNGKQEVKQKGVLGKRTIVTRVTYTDGKETKREVISDKVTVEPVAEIVHIGTHNPKQPPIENTPDEPIDIPEDKPEDEYKPIPEPTEEKTQSSPLMRFVTWLLKLLSDFWNAKR